MTSEEAVDDQNSGWLEVKKKHRSSSKFSLHGWVGGFSGKQSSGTLPSQHLLNVKSQNTNGRCGGQPSNTRGSSAVHGRRIVANPTLVSNKNDIAVHCQDKCVVSQDNKPADSVSQDNKSANSPSVTASKVGGDSRFLEKDDNDVLPKIKWGDLDDDALLVHYGSKKGPQISFGGIEKDDLFKRAENLNVSIASAIASEVKDKSAASANADHVFQEAQFVSIENTSCEANCKEVIKVSSEDVEGLSSTERTFNLRSDVSSVSIASAPDPQDESAKFPDAAHVLLKEHSLTTEKVPFEEHVREVTEVSSEDVKMQTTNEKTLDQSGDVTSCRETQIEHMKEINSEPLDLSMPFGEDSLCGVSEELPAPGICETGGSEILNSISPVASQHDELVLPASGGIDSSREDIATKSGEDHGIKQADEFLDSMSKAQIMSAIDAGDISESKERFRERLWCFLFENLNRAVDELYLLCELECDLEQMKEAILVLEEAASDFKELNSRVEDFERVKKSSPQLIDGATIHMNSDHRRPHALSWEVRRMTSSPSRAEILSSSLEAFRKIQEERDSIAANSVVKLVENTGEHIGAKELALRQRKQVGVSNHIRGTVSGEKRSVDSGRSSKTNLVQNNRLPLQNQSVSEISASRVHLREGSTAVVPGKSKRELVGSSSDMERLLFKKDKMSMDRLVEERPKSLDRLKKQTFLSERDMDKSNPNTWKSMDAWKEKRNWEDILATPFRVSSRYSHSPGMNRKSAERARILHDKLMSPEKKKKSAVHLKKEAEEKHARAMRIRSELENERVQKLQRTSEKVNRVNEWQAIRNMKLREVMYARHQRSESRHEAFLAQVVRRAGDESSKVNEVRFITSLNEENKKLMLRQKLHDSELRRAEKLQTIKSKQKEDFAREEAVLERKKLIDAEKLQRLAETQRKKEEAQVRREEERKASSAAREAKAMEQQRRKEVRAKAQQEEAELLAQKLAERLSESEQRRKFYLEQIRERASMDFRDQSSPFFRRSTNKDGHGRSTPPNNGDEYQTNNISGSGSSALPSASASVQQSLKRRIKKIRQRLMALKYEFSEPSLGAENGGIGYRTAAATARAKIGRWLQDLQRLRQARKEGSESIGLITAEIIRFLEGKDPELQASRQAGLLGFIASALPASHTTKPEACQVTTYLLRLLKVMLSVPANRSYFIAQNLLPPIIPMLTAALENYIKIAASSNVQCSTSKLSMENLESISEVLDGFLWIVTSIIGHVSSDERQLQMQDGLVELVIAYRIIHRLRDLFALYDRPQVEGSPFPSSIILSIDLLAVLTSRFRIMSLINWESFPLKERSMDETQEAMLAEKIDLECSPLCNLSGHHQSASPLPDLPEDEPLNESFSIERNDNSVSIGHNTEKPKLTINKMDRLDAPQEPESILIDKGVRYSVPQKDEKNSVNAGTDQNSENKSILMQPVAFLLSAMSETGLVCLPSPLTAVLLQANNKLSAEQATFILPSNFEEVATGVLKVLNNLALVDITFIQTMLARPDLKTEFFHLMNFLLSHCTSKWGSATDQIGSLLLESLLLLGYFALFHSENQAVLRWGKSPTILHKVCDLPFVFFSDPELMPVLAGTLVAACFGCEQNKCVVQQEISTDMLLSLIRSCKTGLPAGFSNSTSGYPPVEESCESTNLLNPEPRKFQAETLQKSNRCSTRSNRISTGKSAAAGNGSRNVKMRNQKDGKAVKLCEEMFSKNHPSTLETSPAMMLHTRFPGSFIDKAEQFFLAETPV